MGKRLIQQARGKGGPRYRAPSFKYKGAAKHVAVTKGNLIGIVLDIVKCRGHSSPLAEVEYSNGELSYMIAPENLTVGDSVETGPEVEVSMGNILPLEKIPEGTLIFNIEGTPNDGGKFVRSTGNFAKIISHMKNGTIVQLPSKKKKTFHPLCRASVGVIAGGGRKDKPMLKAGKMHYAMKAKNKLWPNVSGNAQNAVDHPFGTSRSLRKSKAKPTSKNAPPGRKVGMVGARHTGRNK